MGNNPKDNKVTEPTAQTAENSPEIETPKVTSTGRLPLKSNQSITHSGCLRTDN